MLNKLSLPHIHGRIRLGVLATAGFAAASLALGCSADIGVPPACTGDNSCLSPSNNVPWAVQLMPSSGTAADPRDQLMPQDQSLLSWSSDGTARLQFRPTVLVHGAVEDAQLQPILGARVIARLKSSIPGQNDYSLGTLTADNPAGVYSLRVPLAQQPLSQTYRFWVGFDDASRARLSPPLWHDTVLTDDSDLTLRLRAASALSVVSGRILDALGEGVGNFSVQVLDAAHDIISSTAISDATTGTTAGSYRLFVDPSLSSMPGSPLTVVARPGPLDAAMPTLEATLPPPSPGTETRVELAVPSHRKPVPFQLPIRGGDSAANSLPVAGARVRAEVVLEDTATLKLGTRAYYVATGESDSQGIARLSLVPAPIGSGNLIYKVAISSPSHVSFASLPEAEVQVGPNDGLLGQVTLPPRAEVRGRLHNAQGEPAASVAIMAIRIAEGETAVSPTKSLVATAELPQNTTDSEGNFVLRLDPGDYDLEFVPAPGAEPRSTLDNQRIGSANVDLGTIHLPTLTLGVLQVLAPSGAPVEGVKVRVFQLPDTNLKPGVSCSGSLPCSRNAKLRAEAFTDQEGRIRCLLPGGSPSRN